MMREFSRRSVDVLFEIKAPPIPGVILIANIGENVGTGMVEPFRPAIGLPQSLK
jgi:hypothetical protein